MKTKSGLSFELIATTNRKINKFDRMLGRI